MVNCSNILQEHTASIVRERNVQVYAADLTQRKKCVGCIRLFMAVLPTTATESRKHPVTVTFPR
jgi:hypothetical protein